MAKLLTHYTSTSVISSAGSATVNLEIDYRYYPQYGADNFSPGCPATVDIVAIRPSYSWCEQAGIIDHLKQEILDMRRADLELNQLK